MSVTSPAVGRRPTPKRLPSVAPARYSTKPMSRTMTPAT
jgi:hypothetical protein